MALPLNANAVMREVAGRTREVELMTKSLTYAIDACRNDARLLANQAMDGSGASMAEREQVANAVARNFVSIRVMRILGELEERDRHATFATPPETDRPADRSAAQLDLGL